MNSTGFSSLVENIRALLAAHPERPVLAALDGRCGSGKTTLAAQLAERFPDSIILHTDDFYLPLPCASPAGSRLPVPIWTLSACGTKR